MSESTPAKATKAKASSAQKQQQPLQTKGSGDLDRLEKAYRSCQGELAKMKKTSATNAGNKDFLGSFCFSVCP